MKMKELVERGWVFELTAAYKRDTKLGCLLVVEYEKNDSQAKVSRLVSEVEHAATELSENADKYKQLKELLS